MPQELQEEMFQRDLKELEEYAATLGYTITSRKNHHYVDVSGQLGPLALCMLRSDAVRIAYALAKTFPKRS